MKRYVGESVRLQTIVAIVLALGIVQFLSVGCSKQPPEEGSNSTVKPTGGVQEIPVDGQPGAQAVDPAETERHEAAKKRMAEIIVETIRLRKRGEKNPGLQKEGTALMSRLTNDDHSREDAVMEEIIRQYAPEQYDDVKTIMEKNKGMQTQARLHNIRTALEQYMMDQGKYPDEGDGLRLLIQRTDRRSLYLDGGEEGIKDSWGNPLIYRLTSPNAYIVKSIGPDGMEGTVDDVELK